MINNRIIKSYSRLIYLRFGCGGWTAKFKQLKFDNVKYRTLHRWAWDSVLVDLDGSLTGGSAGDVVVSATNITMNDPRCKSAQALSSTNPFDGGIACHGTSNWVRFAFNNVVPNLAELVDIQNQNGNVDVSPNLGKRLTHPKGFMMDLEINQTYLEIRYSRRDF